MRDKDAVILHRHYLRQMLRSMIIAYKLNLWPWARMIDVEIFLWRHGILCSGYLIYPLLGRICVRTESISIDHRGLTLLYGWEIFLCYDIAAEPNNPQGEVFFFSFLFNQLYVILDHYHYHDLIYQDWYFTDKRIDIFIYYICHSQEIWLWSNVQL